MNRRNFFARLAGVVTALVTAPIAARYASGWTSSVIDNTVPTGENGVEYWFDAGREVFPSPFNPAPLMSQEAIDQAAKELGEAIDREAFRKLYGSLRFHPQSFEMAMGPLINPPIVVCGDRAERFDLLWGYTRPALGCRIDG